MWLKLAAELSSQIVREASDHHLADRVIHIRISSLKRKCSHHDMMHDIATVTR